MSKKRAFVRYTKSGEIVPGSLVVTTKGGYPDKSSLWKEVSSDLCCPDPDCPTPPVESEYPFRTAPMRMAGWDFYEYESFAPTAADLLNFNVMPPGFDPGVVYEDALGFYRATWNEFYKKQNEVLLYNSNSSGFTTDPGPLLPYLKEEDLYPIDCSYPSSTTEILYDSPYDKGPMSFLNYPSSPKKLGFGDSVRFKDYVQDLIDLPMTNNELGDMRMVVNESAFYIWDGFQWKYDAFFDDSLSTFRAKRDSYIKELYELRASTRPFLCGVEYYVGYRLDNNNFFAFDPADYIFFGVIGDNQITPIVNPSTLIDLGAIYRAVGGAFINAARKFYQEAYAFLTIPYREQLTELYLDFRAKLENVFTVTNPSDIFSVAVTNCPYWDAIENSDETTAYALRPAFKADLKALMASIKNLVEYANGGPIIYTNV